MVRRDPSHCQKHGLEQEMEKTQLSRPASGVLGCVLGLRPKGSLRSREPCNRPSGLVGKPKDSGQHKACVVSAP